jgi:hypothetical protein
MADLQPNGLNTRADECADTDGRSAIAVPETDSMVFVWLAFCVVKLTVTSLNGILEKSMNYHQVKCHTNAIQQITCLKRTR